MKKKKNNLFCVFCPRFSSLCWTTIIKPQTISWLSLVCWSDLLIDFPPHPLITWISHFLLLALTIGSSYPFIRASCQLPNQLYLGSAGSFDVVLSISEILPCLTSRDPGPYKKEGRNWFYYSKFICERKLESLHSRKWLQQILKFRKHRLSQVNKSNILY